MVDPPPLVRPVEGPVVTRFTYDRADPFRAGRRRIVRFRVASGGAVRAPCRGRVTHAGRVPGGAAVTVRCAGWSVTLTGVEPRTARGRRVGGGARIATSTGRPVGLGLRPAADRFGYVDPLPLLRSPRPAVPFAPLGPAPRARPTSPAPAPAIESAPAARPVPAPVAAPAARPLPGIDPGLRPVPAVHLSPATDAGPPLLAWVGLALAALGLPAGAVGVHARRRRARSAADAQAPQGARA